MKNNSTYILSKVNSSLDNNIEEGNIERIEENEHRVELFLNNEYKGVYYLKSIDEKVKEENKTPNIINKIGSVYINLINNIKNLLT